jgi:hypothetical protein
VRNDTPSGTEKDGAGNAETNHSPMESTNTDRNHDRLTESIQKYFGQAREQAEREANELAAAARA